MGTWLFKTDPETYAIGALKVAGRATWDGVANNTALMHLRRVKAGDEVLVYHSGDDKAVMGVARAVSGGYPDPKLKDPKRVVVDVEFVRMLGKPVTLAEIKADPRLREFDLVRISRLSVMPVSPAHRKALRDLGAR